MRASGALTEASTSTVSWKRFRHSGASSQTISRRLTSAPRLPPSLRDVEDLLHERGIEISYETVPTGGPSSAQGLPPRSVASAPRRCAPVALGTGTWTRSRETIGLTRSLWRAVETGSHWSDNPPRGCHGSSNPTGSPKHSPWQKFRTRLTLRKPASSGPVSRHVRNRSRASVMVPRSDSETIKTLVGRLHPVSQEPFSVAERTASARGNPCVKFVLGVEVAAQPAWSDFGILPPGSEPHDTGIVSAAGIAKPSNGECCDA